MTRNCNPVQNRGTMPVMICLSLAAFMSTLDTIMVSVSLPTITKDLQVTTALTSWIFIVTMLVSSSFLMTFGSVGDKLGHRRVFLCGFAIFTVSSLLSGFVADIWLLLALRVFVGVGTGIIMALSPALVATVLPPSLKGKAFGLIAASASVALTAGPIIGGYIIEHFRWNWIFFVNVPIGLVAMILIFRFIPAQVPSLRTRFDYPAAFLLFFSLVGLLFCLNAGDIGGLDAHIVPFILAGSLLLGAAFLWHEHRAPSPMIPLRLFRNVPFTASVFAALFMMTAYGGVLLIFPFFFESVWMFSPEQSGSMLVAASAGIMIASVLAGGLVDRIGCRKPAIIATGLAIAGSILLFVLLGTNIMVLPAVAGLFLFGAGAGGFYPPNISLVMKYAPKGDEGAVSGILMTMRMLGQAVGFALFGTVFGIFAKKASGAAFHGPGTVAPEALLPGFTAVFLVTVLLLVITFLLVLMVRESRESPADNPRAGG